MVASSALVAAWDDLINCAVFYPAILLFGLVVIGTAYRIAECGQAQIAECGQAQGNNSVQVVRQRAGILSGVFYHAAAPSSSDVGSSSSSLFGSRCGIPKPFGTGSLGIRRLTPTSTLSSLSFPLLDRENSLDEESTVEDENENAYRPPPPLHRSPSMQGIWSPSMSVRVITAPTPPFQILRASPDFLRVFGYTSKELRGKTLRILSRSVLSRQKHCPVIETLNRVCWRQTASAPAELWKHAGDEEETCGEGDSERQMRPSQSLSEQLGVDRRISPTSILKGSVDENLGEVVELTSYTKSRVVVRNHVRVAPITDAHGLTRGYQVTSLCIMPMWAHTMNAARQDFASAIEADGHAIA